VYAENAPAVAKKGVSPKRSRKKGKEEKKVRRLGAKSGAVAAGARKQNP